MSPDFQREPGLSDATRTGEGEDRGGGEVRLRIGDLLGATDKAGELVRQVVRKRFERPHRGKFRAQLGPEDLVQPNRRREILEPMLPKIAEAHLVRYAEPISAWAASERRIWPPWPAAQMRAARCTSIPT